MHSSVAKKVRTVARSFALAAALGAVVLGAPAARAQARDPARVDKVSKYSFEDTLDKLKSALKAEHMMIVAKINHKKMLSMVGVNLKGSFTLEFGKPAMGKMLLPMNPAIGLEMPAKIYVFERADGAVVVSYRKAASQFATYGGEVAKAGEMMDMVVDKIASAVTE